MSATLFNGFATINLEADDALTARGDRKGPETENLNKPVSNTLIEGTASAKGTDFRFLEVKAETNAKRNLAAVGPRLAKAVSKNHVTFEYYWPVEDKKFYLHAETHIKKATLTEGTAKITINVTVTPQLPGATSVATLRKVYALRIDPMDATKLQIVGGQPDHMLNGGGQTEQEPGVLGGFTTLAPGTYDVAYDVTLESEGVDESVEIEVTLGLHI
jgi:hypothetical protein